MITNFCSSLNSRTVPEIFIFQGRRKRKIISSARSRLFAILTYLKKLMNLRHCHVLFTFFRRHDLYFILMFTCTVRQMETNATALSIEGSNNSTWLGFDGCYDNMLITSRHESENFGAKLGKLGTLTRFSNKGKLKYWQEIYFKQRFILMFLKRSGMHKKCISNQCENFVERSS